jgi:hypothetical protein
MQQEKIESCCLTCDKNVMIFIVSTAVVCASLGLSIYKLITSKTCDDATPYYILLSNISSLSGSALYHSTRQNKQTTHNRVETLSNV